MGEVTSVSYEIAGALRDVVLPDQRVIEYENDALGRRVGKKIDGVKQWGMLYEDSIRPIAITNATGSVVATFVYASKAQVPDLVETSTAIFRLVTDQIGSVRLVVNTANGAVVQRLDYDEFGVVLNDTNPGFQPFGFAGGLYDADTGFVRFGARDYDAVTGRWTAKDPIGFAAGSTNLYEYAGSSPISFFDPTGLDIWIEGPSGGEPGLHQSINIGDPLGEYDSFSFAVNGGGSVYEDGDLGGEIERYLETTQEQDAAALERILDEAAADNEMWYGPNTCRTYSQDKFEEFKKQFDAEEVAPPARTPAERNPWRDLLSTSGSGGLLLRRIMVGLSTSSSSSGG